MNKLYINKATKIFAILLISCIFSHISLIYIHENNRNASQCVNCYFSYNSNKLPTDVPLRERGSEFCDSFIVCGFFNGVNMPNTKQSVPDYFRSQIIDGTNFEISVMLEKVSTLANLIEQASGNDKDILANIICDYVDMAKSKLHTAETEHLENVLELEGGNA